MDLFGDAACVVRLDHRLVVGTGNGDDDIARGGGVIVGTGIVLHRDCISDGERLAFTQKIERAIGDRVSPGRAVRTLVDSAERQLGGSNDRRIGYVVAIAVTIDPHGRRVTVIDVVDIG